MSPETFVDVFREALWLVTIMVCAVILPSLMVGLV
ncbi:MAG: flagellar export apparatus protein FliQ, partial [Aeromonas sp.]|nr:flagellar export apparatus protein FliQ [Aeromonas sp.]